MALLNLGPVLDKAMKHGLFLTRDDTLVWQSDTGTPDEVVIYTLQLQANSFGHNLKELKLSFSLGYTILLELCYLR